MVPVPYERHHAEQFTTSALDKWATGNLAPLGVFDSATGEVLGSAGATGTAEELVQRWELSNKASIARAINALGEFNESTADLAPLSVLLRQIRTLVRSSAH
jgi:hypothetical protein